MEGLVLGGIVFGVVVRLAAKRRGRGPSVAALAVALAGVLALAIPYSARQPIVAAAAAALGLVGVERSDGSSRIARAAIGIGLLVIASLDRVHGLRRGDRRLARELLRRF